MKGNKKRNWPPILISHDLEYANTSHANGLNMPGNDFSNMLPHMYLLLV